MIKNIKSMWNNHEKLQKDELGQASQQFVLLLFCFYYFIYWVTYFH